MSNGDTCRFCGDPKQEKRIAELEAELAALRAHSELLREAAQAVVERCHGLEGYPTGCDLQLLIGALAALLKE